MHQQNQRDKSIRRALTAVMAFGLCQGVFAQSTDESALSAKALFYNAEGAISKVGSSGATAQETASGTLSKLEENDPAKRPSGATTVDALPKKRPFASDQTRPLALRASVLLVLDDGKSQEVKPSHWFRTGDRMRLSFASNKTGYFYLATKGTSGKVQILAPRQGEPAIVQAGNRYTFPSSPNAFFRFDGKTGKEQLWAVLSDTPLSAINMGDGLIASLSPEQSPEVVGASVALAGKSLPIVDFTDALAAKDLVFEEDANALFASVKPVAYVQSTNGRPPVVVKLVLNHQ